MAIILLLVDSVHEQLVPNGLRPKYGTPVSWLLNYFWIMFHLNERLCSAEVKTMKHLIDVYHHSGPKS